MATTAKLKPSTAASYSDAIVSAASEDLGLRNASNGFDLDMQAMRGRMKDLEARLPENMESRLRLGLLSQELAETINSAANGFREEGEPPVRVSRSHEIDATETAFYALTDGEGSALIDIYSDEGVANKLSSDAGMNDNLLSSFSSGLDSLQEGQRQFILGELENDSNLKSYDDVIAKVNTSLGRFDHIFNENSNREKIDSVATFNDALPNKTALVNQEIANRVNIKPNSDFLTHGGSVVESARTQVDLTDTPNGLDLDMNQLLARVTDLENKLPETTDPRLSLSLMVQELSETIKTSASNIASDNGDEVNYTRVPPQHKAAEIGATKDSFQYLAEKRDAYISLPADIYDPKGFFRNSDVESSQRRSLLAGIDALDEGPKQYALGQLAANPNLKTYADIDAQLTESLERFDATYNSISDRPSIDSLATFKNNLTLEPPMPTPKNEETPAATPVETPPPTETPVEAASSTVTVEQSEPTEVVNNAPHELSDDGELIIKAVKDNKLNSTLGLDEPTIRTGLLAAEQKMPAGVDERVRLGLLHQELGNMAAAFAKPEQDLKTPLFKVARDSYVQSPTVEDGFISFVGKNRPTDNSPMSEQLTAEQRGLVLEGLKPLTQSEKQYVGANLMDNPDIDFDQTIDVVKTSLQDFGNASSNVNPDNGLQPVQVFTEALDKAKKVANQKQPAPTQQQSQQTIPQQQGSNDMTPPDFSNIPFAESENDYQGSPVDNSLDDTVAPKQNQNKQAKQAKPSPSADAVARIQAETQAQRQQQEAATTASPAATAAEDALKNRSEVEILMKAIEDNEFFGGNTDVGEIESRLLAAESKIKPLNPSDSLLAAVLHQELAVVGNDLLKANNAKTHPDGSKLSVVEKNDNKVAKFAALNDVAKAHFTDSHRLGDHRTTKSDMAFDGINVDEINLLHNTISKLPNGVRQHALSELKDNLSKLPEHGFDDVVNSVKQTLSDFDTIYKSVNPNAKPQLKSFSDKLEVAATEINKTAVKPIQLTDFTPKPLEMPAATESSENTNTQTAPPNSDAKLTNSVGGKDNNPKKDPRLEDDPNSDLYGAQGQTQIKTTYSLFNFNRRAHPEVMRELQFKRELDAKQTAMRAAVVEEAQKSVRETSEAYQAEQAEKAAAKQAAKESKQLEKAAKKAEKEAKKAERQAAANPADDNSPQNSANLNSDGTVTPNRNESINDLADLLDSNYEGPDLNAAAPVASNEAPVASNEAPVASNAAPVAPNEAPTPLSPIPQNSPTVAPPITPPASLLSAAPKPEFNDSLTDNFYKGIQRSYAEIQDIMDVCDGSEREREHVADRTEMFLHEVGGMAEHLERTTTNATVEDLAARNEGLDFVKSLKSELEDKAEKNGYFSSNDYDPMADMNNRATHPLKDKFKEADSKIKEAKDGMEAKSSGLMAGLGAKIGGLFGRKP